MQMLIDFLPVLAFFVVFKLYGMQAAVATMMIATVAVVAYGWFVKRRLEKLPLISLALVLVLGGATLALDSELFIKWKPTVVNWLFAAVFLGSQYIGRAPLVERMMSHALSLPAAVWRRVNMAWVVFFLFSGVLNLIVAYSVDTETWVDFKVFGLLGLTLVFVLAQGVYLARHAQQPSTEE